MHGANPVLAPPLISLSIRFMICVCASAGVLVCSSQFCRTTGIFVTSQQETERPLSWYRVSISSLLRLRFFETLDEMSVNAFDDQCTGANPRYPMISEIKEMYLNAYYGRKEEK